MKVAVCISGHMRTYHNTYQSLYDKILNKYNCDVFIATYPTLGSAYSHIKGVDGILVKSSVDLEHIKHIFNPKKIKIIENDDFLHSYYNYQYYRFNIGMFRAIYECNQLKIDSEQENNKKYDLVLRIRPDIIIDQISLELPSPKSIIVPNRGKAHDNGITDQIAFASSDVMDIYSLLYKRADKLKTEYNLQHPEIILKKYLEDNKIFISYKDIVWTILRTNGQMLEIL